jgi:hypothetical protein
VKPETDLTADDRDAQAREPLSAARQIKSELWVKKRVKNYAVELQAMPIMIASDYSSPASAPKLQRLRSDAKPFFVWRDRHHGVSRRAFVGSHRYEPYSLRCMDRPFNRVRPIKFLEARFALLTVVARGDSTCQKRTFCRSLDGRLRSEGTDSTICPRRWLSFLNGRW